MEDKIYSWTLGNQKTISKTESQSVLIMKFMDTWQKIINSQKEKEILGSVMSADKWNI